VPVAQISSLDRVRSGRRLAALLRGHDALSTAFHAAQLSLQRRAELVDDPEWDELVLGLLDANLGEVALRSFLQLSERWPLPRSVTDLLAVGRTIRDVGREAGSRSAQILLAELPKILHRLPTSADMNTVLTALRLLAEAAPDSVPLVASRLEQLLAHADADGFAAWVSGGLRSSATSASRRRAYFRLDDGLSARLLDLGHSGSDYLRLERRLAANMAAMWNRKPRFRKLVLQQALPVPRRTSLTGGVIGLPETFSGFTGHRADAIYRAAVVHSGAHAVHSTVRFSAARLKPVQITLVSLIEDARVEALALRAMPGLLRLWLPFHTVQPSDQATTAALMMRLSRALIDPNYVDDDAWVGKGRMLFSAAADRLDDPAVSREIGGLLGNDLGQMRLQFNARSYVVEPAYRDDNQALWNFGDQPDSPTEEIELPVESVRIERRDDAGGQQPDDASRSEPAQRARGSKVTVLDGIPVATYPEWDYAAGLERPDWATILEADAPVGSEANVADTWSDSAGLSHRIAALTRDASVGRRVRHKGQREGDALDIDACIALTAERRAGLLPEARVYQRDVPGPRDLAILLLLDLSQSTADRDRHGRPILAVEREAATIMAAAVQEAGDAIAVHGFNSDGRERVRYLRIKGFDEPMDGVVRARLAGLRSDHSTRLGPALRHAGNALARRRAFRRVLLVLTDGEPSDIDVQDPLYLAEDARRAVQQLRRRGVDTFAFGMGSGPFHLLAKIFGERRALRVPRIEVLPARIMHLYSELKK
jgi:nitric oxide reductase NorD protein